MSDSKHGCPAHKVKRLHCSGISEDKSCPIPVGCHLACYCTGCDRQWVEPCEQVGHGRSSVAKAEAA